MNWNDWVGAVAATLAIVGPAILLVGWVLRKWLLDQLNKLTPHLTNDDVSVATYAHEARDAALTAKDAALAAKDASYDAKHAAIDAKTTALEVKRLLESK